MNNYRSFDNILQLTDVSGPRISSQHLHRFARNRINGLMHPLGKLLDEMQYEQRNVFRAFAQRRNDNWKNIQAVVEVAAKLLLLDHLFQVAMGRGHDSNVNSLRPGTAQSLEFPFLQDTKELRL